MNESRYPYRSVYFGVDVDRLAGNLEETAHLLGIKSGRGAAVGIGPIIKAIARIPAPTLARILKPYINGGDNEQTDA